MFVLVIYYIDKGTIELGKIKRNIIT